MEKGEAAGKADEMEGRIKKRRKTLPALAAKEWLFDSHECMKVKHRWNMMKSWRRAQEMLPSLLKDVNAASVYTWTHSDCAKNNKTGRERKLNIANPTLLGQAGDNLAGQVAVTSRTYQQIAAAESEKQGVDWTPCRRWVRWFLAACGHSYKHPGVDAAKERSEETKKPWQSNFQATYWCGP